MAYEKGNIFIGTSGYSYKHWQNNFYPLELLKSKWLEFYSQNFNTVELNVTFYRLPDTAAFKNWHDKTPENFIFSLKGSRFITHIKRLKDVQKPLELFFKRAGFLSEKLGCVLWQLSPNFWLNIERLEKFLNLIKSYNVRNVFEFRHESWFAEKVFALLKKYNSALCLADYPDFKVEKPTDLSDFIYLRRHGINNIYASSYTEQELTKDAKMIKKFLSRGQDVYIYFNNDANAYAVFNVRTLRQLLAVNNYKKGKKAL